MLLFLTSCASMIPKPYEMAAPDRLFIHDNAKAGDYAVYLVGDAGITHRYEVYERTDSSITVRYRMNYLDPDYKDLSPKEWYYRQINNDGKVLKAWAVTDAGERFPTPVAQQNAIGSLEHLTKIDKKPKQPLETNAGAFKVDNINAYIYRTDAGLVSTNSSCMEYYSEKIPFKVLKREMLHTADVGAFLKTLEYIKVIGEAYLNDSYMKLYNKATEGEMKYQSTFELMEYGFGK